MSDEHSRKMLGAYGNSYVKTPTLDALAEEGMLFESAYTNCPICVPARASLATGRYVHEIGNWDNAMPYSGSPAAWGHRLLAAGRRCDSIGKLHYRSTDDNNGFGNEILPLHVLNGEGDLQGMIRRPPPLRPTTSQLAGDAGPGESTYLAYDRSIRDAAKAWIAEAAAQRSEDPWCLFVSFVCPHFPLVAPEEFFKLYPLETIPMPDLRDAASVNDHPVLRKLREVQNYHDHFKDDDHIRVAIASYLGMVSFLDDNIRQILEALTAGGFDENTLVIYSSDHGDNLGSRTFWGKSNMYEESAGIPLIIRGPGVAKNERTKTPVSLVDIFPTIIEAAGLAIDEADRELPGRSLLQLMEGHDQNRTVFGEYHAVGSITGMFMVRFDRFKYIRYEGYEGQLFDLQADPQETVNLVSDPDFKQIVEEGERRLRAICDPSEVNRRAFEAQDRSIAAHGGVEKVLQGGSYPYTPAPGEAARFA